MLKLGIIGCTGRMGKALIEQAQLDNNILLIGGSVRDGSQKRQENISHLINGDPVEITIGNSNKELIKSCDAVIDFTTPEVSLQNAKLCAEFKKILVIGTTGFSEEEFTRLKEYGKKTKIVWGSNMSLGVNLLNLLTSKTAQILGEDFDIEVLEMHHNKKVDSPSGTALTLGEHAAKGRDLNLNEVKNASRDGIIGERKKNEIGFATLRGGTVVGEHTVIFAGDNERVELTHKASDRKIFAKGAIKASLWADEQKNNGYYTMMDVVTVF